MTCPFLLPPQLCCVISIKRHIHGKSFYAERTPQLPFSAHKKQVEKRMASVGEVGGSWREMIEIYICVCEAKVEQKKWNIYAVLSNVNCFLFFYFHPFHLDFYI